MFLVDIVEHVFSSEKSLQAVQESAGLSDSVRNDCDALVDSRYRVGSGAIRGSSCDKYHEVVD